MRTSSRTIVIGAAAAVAVGATVTTTIAAVLEPDGVHLEAQWTNGGHAWLELEDRNVEPTICFIWDNDVPQDGDSIASRILTRTGTVVVDLGTGDQWVDGSGSGCEIPRGDRFLDVFANPGDYVVEFEVVENQGTARTAPLRSRPLAPASS